MQFTFVWLFAIFSFESQISQGHVNSAYLREIYDGQVFRKDHKFHSTPGRYSKIAKI